MRSKYILMKAMEDKAAELSGDDTSGRYTEHRSAWSYPRNGFEAGIKSMILGVMDYADRYLWQHQDQVSSDGLAGPYILDMMRSLNGLIGCDTGRLDGSLLAELLTNMRKQYGFPEG